MPSDEEKKRFGRDGEDLAAHFLRSRGFRIRERNFRCRQGEIDIITEREHDGKIVFVEVKSRHGVDSVSPRELVPFGKQVRLSKAAQHYVARKKLQDADAGFAVLIVDHSQSTPSFELIEDAFDLAYGY